MFGRCVRRLGDAMNWVVLEPLWPRRKIRHEMLNERQLRRVVVMGALVRITSIAHNSITSVEPGTAAAAIANLTPLLA